MTRNVAGPVTRQVDVARNDAAAVAAHDLHGDARPALEAAADVGAVPGQAQGYLSINPNRREHGARVLDRRVAARGQQREPRDRDDLEPQQEHPPLLGAVGVPAGADGGGAGEDVGRHAQQLRVVGRVAHALDDGGQEEREGVDGREPGHEDEHENIDLPVRQGLPDVLDVEVLGEVAVVDGEAALDFVVLLVGEEAGSVLRGVSLKSCNDEEYRTETYVEG